MNEEHRKADCKSRFRTFEVKSVPEFTERATWLFTSERVIFRGQTKEHGWPLLPSVARNANRSLLFHKEADVLQAFKREAFPYVEPIPTTDWQWLAIAQHSGLPTRLLDWSTNPLAALWFAVKDASLNGQSGIVWAHNYDESDVVDDTTKRGSPMTIGRDQVYFPEHASPFIQGQSAVFTIHHRSGNPPGQFERFEDSVEPLLLNRIEIPADCLCSLRYQLFRIGISPATLFPGLRGVAETLRYRYVRCADEN